MKSYSLMGLKVRNVVIDVRTETMEVGHSIEICGRYTKIRGCKNRDHTWRGYLRSEHVR